MEPGGAELGGDLYYLCVRFSGFYPGGDSADSEVGSYVSDGLRGLEKQVINYYYSG